MSQSLIVPAIPAFVLQFGLIAIAIPFLAPPVWFGIKGAIDGWKNSDHSNNQLLNSAIGLIKGIGKGILTDLIGVGFLTGTTFLATISPPLFLAATASIFTFASVSIANSISDVIGLKEDHKLKNTNPTKDNKELNKSLDNPSVNKALAQETNLVNPFNPNLTESQIGTKEAVVNSDPKPTIPNRTIQDVPTQDIKQAEKAIIKEVEVIVEKVNIVNLDPKPIAPNRTIQGAPTQDIKQAAKAIGKEVEIMAEKVNIARDARNFVEKIAPERAQPTNIARK